MSSLWDFSLLEQSDSLLFSGIFDEFRFDGGGGGSLSGLHSKRKLDEIVCKVESSSLTKRANTVDRDSSFCDNGNSRVVDAAFCMMEETHSCRAALQHRLESCVIAQRSIDLSDHESVARHAAALRELHHSIVMRKVWVVDTLAKEVWRPSALVALKRLSASLLELQTSVELCTEELTNPASGSMSRLVIVAQDCGRPIAQGEGMGAAVLKVVSSPRSPAWPATHVSVRTVGADGLETDLKLKYAAFQMTATTSAGLHAVQITCPSLCIEKPTRSKSVWLQFSAGTMKSVLSQPVVVISSKKQKFDALATLLVQDLFVDPTSVLPRNTVANALQLAYLQSTGQDATSDTSRPLSSDDLKHVFEVALGPGVIWISQPQFLKVWEWFGGMLSYICYDKHTLDMWTRGTIMGLVNKEQAADILKRQDEKRAFILRFSGQQPGSLAVAWRDAVTGEVKHYAITKNDVNVSCSLARFLDEKQCLGWVVQAAASFESPMRWKMEGKAKALGKFFQPPRPKKLDGYEDIL